MFTNEWYHKSSRSKHQIENYMIAPPIPATAKQINPGTRHYIMPAAADMAEKMINSLPLTIAAVIY